METTGYSQTDSASGIDVGVEAAAAAVGGGGSYLRVLSGIFCKRGLSVSICSQEEHCQRCCFGMHTLVEFDGKLNLISLDRL